MDLTVLKPIKVFTHLLPPRLASRDHRLKLPFTFLQAQRTHLQWAATIVPVTLIRSRHILELIHSRFATINQADSPSLYHISRFPAAIHLVLHQCTTITLVQHHCTMLESLSQWFEPSHMLIPCIQQPSIPPRLDIHPRHIRQLTTCLLQLLATRLSTFKTLTSAT